MHECASGWSFRLRDGPLRTPDVPPLPHSHHALLRHAVPSQTAGPRSSGLTPGSITPPRPATAPPAPLRFPNSSVPVLVPGPARTRARPHDTPIRILATPSPPAGTAPPHRPPCSKPPLTMIARQSPQRRPPRAPGPGLFLRGSLPPETASSRPFL